MSGPPSSAGPRGPGGPPGPGGPRRPPFRRGPPRPPPTAEQVAELAHRDHVPFRIARGDLEGKMKTRIWRKLHAEEAKRFDQAYALMAQTPGLELPDAFALVQSGMSLDTFRARRARTQKKVAVKEARKSVEAKEVEDFLQGLVAENAEVCVVLGERTLLDVLKSVQPVSLTLEKTPRLEKLQVVVLARRAVWEKLNPTLERDAKLAQKPTPVPREPEKRVVSDPRVFTEFVGKKMRFSLRNGITLDAELHAVGPFDLLLSLEPEGDGPPELFVPLHALLKWEPAP